MELTLRDCKFDQERHVGGDDSRVNESESRPHLDVAALPELLLDVLEAPLEPRRDL